MPRTQKQTEWDKAHPALVKRYRDAYEQRNKVDRREDKKRWWRKNKGRYGTRDEWRKVMVETGGIGYEALWKVSKKGGRPKKVR
jgi:hypothetical protein